MADLGNIITSFFGTTFEFYNILMSTAAKVFRRTSLAYRLLISDSSSLPCFCPSLSPAAAVRPVPPQPQFKLDDMVEEINETHVGSWSISYNDAHGIIWDANSA